MSQDDDVEARMRMLLSHTSEQLRSINPSLSLDEAVAVTKAMMAAAEVGRRCGCSKAQAAYAFTLLSDGLYKLPGSPT